MFHREFYRSDALWDFIGFRVHGSSFTLFAQPKRLIKEIPSDHTRNLRLPADKEF